MNTHKQPKNGEENLLSVSKRVQFETVEELIEKSQPNDSFYLLLVLSSVIIAAGILLNQVPIIIGGMLVTPLLTPVLAIALGLTVGHMNLIHHTGKLLLKSMAAIILGSVVLGFIFGNGVDFPQIINSSYDSFLYFIVAVASGIAVTFAWIRKEISEVVPGLAIAVSLVPPLSWIGVSLAQLQWTVAGSYAIVFIFNVFGIVIGSWGVFSLSQFNKSERIIEKKADEVIEEAKEKAEEKKKEKELSQS